MKASDYVIEFLAERGVDKIFVLYGAANGPLIDSFTRTNRTRYIATMHEQGAGFASEGYARIRQIPGAAIVTSGPGAQNIVTAIANCYFDSIPTIFISGQINANFLRPDPSIRQVGFQECDIAEMVRPITKYAKMVTKSEDIRYEMEKAWFIAQERRPGPVLLDIPINVQNADIDPAEMFGFNEKSALPTYDLPVIDDQIDSYIADLRNAKRPAIMVGGGARLSQCVDQLREVAILANIPCFPTWNALDTITTDFSMFGGRIGTYGGAGRNFGIQNTDLLLAVGSRIPGRITGGNVSTFAREAKKYVVDVDPALLQRKLQEVPFDENIYCDARVFCERLLARIKKEVDASAMSNYQPWVDQVMEWKRKYDPVTESLSKKSTYAVDGVEYTHPYKFTRELSRQADENAIICGDHGGISVIIAHALDTKTGQRYMSSNGNSAIGYSMAAAIGAWFAAPDRQIISLIGDGGMNMNIQELQTLINYDVNIKVFIMNNHIYGITKAYQLTNFNGRTEACGPEGYNPPRFTKIADAYGVKTFTINCDDEIEDCVREALAFDGPVVCDVNMHEFHTYQPRIFGWSTPIEDMYPYLPRDEFRKNLFIEPHESWENPVYPDIRVESME